MRVVYTTSAKGLPHVRSWFTGQPCTPTSSFDWTKAASQVVNTLPEFQARYGQVLNFLA